ncbi:MAG: hypothetical protein E7773_08190 [Sphingomonas sp.]|uniref:hypothetical protein n=1 Tax=Sphingomonas sp. TaxID=28214 RepID=UPI00120FD1CB|nr:hypothetical protein [Sphingomonas sp.]THD35919.1 MAG: hypothetical protein E7773_08190 [Sphingomonas sp.]
MASLFTKPRLLLFALVWLSCAWFGSWALNPNNSTRMFAAIALVEHHSAEIDEYRDLTIDKAEFGGHVYLDKAPGMTLLALPATAIAERVSTKPPLPPTVWDKPFEQWVTVHLRLAVALVSALLTALAAVALYDLGLRTSGSAGGALFASLAFALGTPMWGWSTTLFGHAPVADLFVIAVWALWRSDGRFRFAGIAGAALGLAVLIEFQAVLAGSVIALWGAFRLRKPRPLIAAALAGAAVLLVPLIGYNMLAFGTPFRLGYQGVSGFPGMNEGLFGLTSPKFAALSEIIVGLRRGILWVAPVLLLTPFGLWQLARRERGLALTAASAAVVVLLVNAAYVYWDGGHSTGPRHSVPAIGLLAIGLATFWANRIYWWERAFAAAILCVSIAINLAIAAANITAPDTYAFPLWDPILKTDWAGGTLRTLPSDFLGWTPFAGVALYLVLAIPLAVLLVRAQPKEA